MVLPCLEIDAGEETEMSICTSGAVTFANQRRSQRILLAVPLLVSGRHADGTAFAEHASTLIVNASGGLIALKVAVSVAQTLSLKNENTDNDISCAVVNVELRASGLHEVGIEFRGDDRNFWRVNFPPTDWTSRSPDAKRYDQNPQTTPARNPTAEE
jgi:hypothetical protein